MTLPKSNQAGVGLHVSSLPGKYGIGEIGAAACSFIDAMAAMNLGAWQFLPMGPTGFGNSPYQALSTFAGNELLIDMENLVQLGILEQGYVAPLQRLPLNYVDYGALIPLKNILLATAAEAFPRKANSGLRAELDSFLATNDPLWLHDYALYRLLKARHGGQSWTAWDPRYARRDSRALRAIEQSEGPQLERIKIIQFLFARQWAELRRYAHSNDVVLFGDLPIYIPLDSADAWAHPELLLTDQSGQPKRVAGVPPDYFSADGQLWGNPLYDWQYHAAQGFSWWIERLRHALAQADMVRIDHFRGFESYWSVPADATTAREGHWEPGPQDAIFTAIRAALGDVPIIAEDLGIITPAVERLRERQGIPGMRVLQFDIVAEHFDIAAIKTNSVCYTGTHDNDTTVGWFQGAFGAGRTAGECAALQALVLARTGGSVTSIHTDMIKLAFSSAARLAVAPMQDYLGLGSEARLNLPGTTGGNWSWRLLPAELSSELLDSVAQMTTLAGRAISRRGF